MAVLYPDLENIQRLKVLPTAGEWNLINYLKDHLDDTYEIFFNPFLDGDRPDFVILKEHCSAFIIEVKDWNLRNYRVTENNSWRVLDRTKSSNKASPHSQVFRYKKNLYDLHLPVIGLARLKNPNFYKLVHCFVYFYNSDKDAISSLYSPAEEKQKEDQAKRNALFQQKKMDFHSYEKANGYLDSKKRALQRDKGMSFGSDRLELLVIKIKQKSNHVLFDENVYRDFKRRLSPSEHTLKQGISINFDKKQLPLTKSKNGKEKIKGVAGCGKTSILAQRAINAQKGHKEPVLILTFNITLKNHIRDKISDIQGCRNFSFYEISNYHQFFNSQINNTGKDFVDLIDQYGIAKLYSVDVFQGENVTKYQTILIDEIQDYQAEWVKIIRDNFLSPDGEMVLFGDESQNIYQREVVRSPVIAQGFGQWIKISRSYRTGVDSPLNQLFKDFQVKFLVEKYTDTEINDVKPTQFGMGFNLLKYESIAFGRWREDVFDSIQNYIRGYDLNSNDVVILCSKISLVRQLNEFWVENEKTHCMFETYEELSVCTNKSIDELNRLDEIQVNNLINQNKEMVERVRRAKKNHFYANSGLIKLSTIHSYKGLESKSVFFVMRAEDEAEVVYTSITRSSENLVIFDLSDKNICSSFLRQNINQ